MLLTIITFALILLVLVLIHEFGHFLAAKKIGVKVEEFAFGFPPRLFTIKKGETQYSINALPIGGYVKLYGEDEAGGGKVDLKVDSSKLKVSDEKRAYYAQSPLHKLYIGVAGVVMNALLAIAIFYVYFFISGFKTDLSLFPSSHPSFFLANQTKKTEVVVTDVVRNSPAFKAGIRPIAVITKINGEAIVDTAQFTDDINKNKGKEVSISWKEVSNPQKLAQSREFTGKIIPRVSPPPGEGSIGIAFYSVSTLRLSYDSALQRLLSGVVHPVNLMKYNLEVTSSLIVSAIKTKNAKPLSNSVAGPVGIYSIVGSIVSLPDAKERILEILNLAGILSISLAFFNILPIPALDGGRVFFVLIEMVVGRRLHPKIEAWANTVGMALLIGLILLTTFHDIVRQLSGGGF